jgi:hypothetical protein
MGWDWEWNLGHGSRIYDEIAELSLCNLTSLGLANKMKMPLAA